MTSQPRIIRCGVPHLGPILFLIYINDLPNCLRTTTASLFADDTNLTASRCSIIDIQIKLNNDLENIHQWLLANKLTLNKDKTEYMIAGSRQRISKIEGDPEVKLGNCNIKRVKETKTLGVIIDDQLKWNAHIDNGSCLKVHMSDHE